MAIRPVLRLGEPSLHEVSRPVEMFNTAELDSLIRDMFDTMEAEDGAGLAAPQIGVNLRVVIFGYDHNPRYPEAPAIPETVLINPEISPIGDSRQNGWEGCLSVPGMRGMVSRHTEIRYTGFDQHGNLIDRTASDFHSRVVQHECDHLDGIIYTQRLIDSAQFGFLDELLENKRLF